MSGSRGELYRNGKGHFVEAENTILARGCPVGRPVQPAVRCQPYQFAPNGAPAPAGAVSAVEPDVPAVTPVFAGAER